MCGCCYDATEELCDIDGAWLEPVGNTTRVIDGRYRLEWLLGRGGAGAVYQAADVRSGRKIAVRVISRLRMARQADISRFERELETAARLRHPNITAIYDFARNGCGGAYMTMELLRGATWRRQLDKAAPIAANVLLSRFTQLLDGVQSAHAAGVVHGDLRPENVVTEPLPGKDEIVKILDFGLAAIRGRSGARDAGGGASYWAPEQHRGTRPGKRSDIYSIGLIAVEALTGRASRTPRENASPQAARLSEVLRWCLSPDARNRPGSIQELRDALLPGIAACPPFVDPGEAPATQALFR